MQPSVPKPFAGPIQCPHTLVYAYMRTQAEHKHSERAGSESLLCWMLGHPFHLEMQTEKKKKEKGGFSSKGKNAIKMDPPRKALRRQRSFPSAASQTFGAGVGVFGAGG